MWTCHNRQMTGWDRNGRFCGEFWITKQRSTRTRWSMRCAPVAPCKLHSILYLPLFLHIFLCGHLYLGLIKRPLTVRMWSINHSQHRGPHSMRRIKHSPSYFTREQLEVDIINDIGICPCHESKNASKYETAVTSNIRMVPCFATFVRTKERRENFWLRGALSQTRRGLFF